MTQREIINDYFNWLYDWVCGRRFSKHVSYRKLLMRLHDTEFTYLIERDENRAADGTELRYRYCTDQDMYDVPECLDGPCSVLEMIVALAIRCEENIMDDPHLGDRTGQWIWNMITNLGLGSMTDEHYDREYIDNVVDTFLNREYYPDGKGGLFRIRDCHRDLREVEIWIQMCWYLDSFE